MNPNKAQKFSWKPILKDQTGIGDQNQNKHTNLQLKKNDSMDNKNVT